MPNNHTSFRRHQPVMVILTSGERFRAKFVEERSRFYLVSTDGGVQRKLNREEVRSMSIYRAPSEPSPKNTLSGGRMSHI